jgi:hypothetical protein
MINDAMIRAVGKHGSLYFAAKGRIVEVVVQNLGAVEFPVIL